MIKSTIQFESRDKILLLTYVMGKNYDVLIFTSKYLILRRPRLVNFAEIIKIATTFIKATLKDNNKKELEIMY